jgi:hypothetical protein
LLGSIARLFVVAGHVLYWRASGVVGLADFASCPCLALSAGVNMLAWRGFGASVARRGLSLSCRLVHGVLSHIRHQLARLSSCVSVIACRCFVICLLSAVCSVVGSLSVRWLVGQFAYWLHLLRIRQHWFAVTVITVIVIVLFIVIVIVCHWLSVCRHYRSVFRCLLPFVAVAVVAVAGLLLLLSLLLLSNLSSSQ